MAAYITTQAQLRLYKYLNELGESVLYCNMDYVIFIHNVDEPPKVRAGDYLGHLTDELEEFGFVSYIEEFVSGGPKNYAFSVFCPSTENTYNQVQSEGYNFELRKLKGCELHYLEGYDATPVRVHNPKKIRRKQGGVVSEPQTKEYKVVFKKRRIMDNFDSFP